ncbi:hypothetical protein PPERSA_06582 [Pseudocohnilembus persalinus]|uniref:Uncharacterized protein n=1 Tax=Pseudocohnilembus persalinus TaxID=266149 RepID=A0A0V0QRV4_PSEPJ|nr:hypothetical protein PPERSA_06582 [Pseudocohnilembus persalinus]|eukprot:KRX04948.1 hypothetical protein PPERSA_06582 [Pseudocohnilembus persalinus]
MSKPFKKQFCDINPYENQTKSTQILQKIPPLKTKFEKKIISPITLKQEDQNLDQKCIQNYNYFDFCDQDEDKNKNGDNDNDDMFNLSSRKEEKLDIEDKAVNLFESYHNQKFYQEQIKKICEKNQTTILQNYSDQTDANYSVKTCPVNQKKEIPCQEDDEVFHLIYIQNSQQIQPQ